MPNSIKDIKEQITTDLQQAQEEGKLRSERIREIVQAAVSQATSEIKEGSTEIRLIVKEAVSTVIDNVKERREEIKEDITATIEGAIQGITSLRRQSIAKNQEQLKQLQTSIDNEEQELQKQIDSALTEIERDEVNNKSPQVKAALESAINNLKDTEEVSLMKKRYAQLQAQLAVIQANLAAKYGERYDDVKKHLDDAKHWYERTQPQAEVVADQVKQKNSDFEKKLGEAGTALARGEQRVKQLLRELFHSITEDSHNKK